MSSKTPAKSKTLWFNALSIAAAVLTAVLGVIPPPALPYVLIAQGLVNFGLRLVTGQPIKMQ